MGKCGLNKMGFSLFFFFKDLIFFLLESKVYKEDLQRDLFAGSLLK